MTSPGQINFFETGRVIGSLLPTVLIVIGVVRTLVLLRRKETEGLCMTARLLFLLGWLCTTLLAAVQMLFPLEPATWPIGVVLAVGFPLLLITSTGFAIAGLVRFRGKRTPYAKGRTSAVWVLCVNALLLLALVASNVGTLRQAAAAWAADAPGSAVASGAVKTFEELNFRFEAPGSPWFSVDPKAVNPIATLIYEAKREQSLFMIIAERVGVDALLSTETLVEVSKASFSNAADQPVFENLGTHRTNGLDYQRFRAQGNRFGLPYFYHYQVVVHNGWCYQLISSSSVSQEVADRIAQDFSGRFRMIDPDLKCYSMGRALTESLPLPRLGVTLHLHHDGWIGWNSSDLYPGADFGASLGNQSHLALFSIDLRGADPGLEDLTSTCLRVLWNTPDPEQTDSIEPFAWRGIQGNLVRMRRSDGSQEMEDLIWIYRHLNRACCLITWTDAAMAARLKPSPRLIERLEHGGEEILENDGDLNAPQRELRSQFFNDLGVNGHAAGADPETALEYFRVAYAFAPKMGAASDNVVGSYQAMNRFEEAAAFLDGHTDQVDSKWQDQLRARAGRNWALAESWDKALERYAEAFASDLKDDDSLWDYVTLLRQHRSPEEALQAATDYQAKHPSDQVLRWKAGLLADANQLDQAIADLEARLAHEPFNPAIAYDLAAHCLDDENQLKRCLELCDLLENKGEKGWEISWLRGNAYMGLELYLEAKTSFEAGLEVNKDHPLFLKQALAQASAALGEGDNSMVKTELPPVPIPDQVAQSLAKASPPKDDTRGFQMLYHVSAIHFKEGEPRQSTRYQKIRITAKSGWERYKTLRFSFSPTHEQIFVNDLTVRDSSGEVLAQGDVSDYYVLDENSHEMATGQKVLHVPVPGLEIGAVIEFSVTTKEFASADEFRFGSYPFYTYGPCGMMAVSVTGDFKKAGVVAPANLTVLEGKDFRAWTLRQVPLAWVEEQQPEFDTFLPVLYLGDGAATWKQAGEDYLERIGSLLREDATSIAETARRLTKDEPSTDGKIHLLAQHVRKHLAYQAVEFGKRGTIPRPASKCLRNRFGDCKEHSLLLQQLLRAVGVPSHLTLVDTNSPLIEALPSLNQFNHMILFVPAGASDPGAGRFIDCTDDGLSADLPPDGLAGQRVLVLEPGAVRLAVIPDYPVGSAWLSADRRVTLDQQGELSVRETVEAEGYCASWMRSFFADGDSVSHEARVQELLQYDGLRVLTVTLPDLGQPEGRFRMVVVYSLGQNSRMNPDGSWDVRLPGPWERHFLEPVFQKSRRTPFQSKHPIQFHSTVHLENSPEIDWRALDWGEIASSGSDSFHSWSISRKDHQGGVAVTMHLDRNAFLHPPDRYADYLTSVEQSQQLWHEQASVGAAKGKSASRSLRLDFGRLRNRPVPLTVGPSGEAPP